MEPMMIQNVKANSKSELEKSFYVLTRQLTKIEDTFNVHMQSKINSELHRYQQYILSTTERLDHLKNV